MVIVLLYLFGFFLGVTLGFLIPEFVSWSLFFLGLFVIVLVTEAIGFWGFGSHWRTYRRDVYIIYSHTNTPWRQPGDGVSSRIQFTPPTRIP
jgi:hypothetical protein